MNSYKLTKEQRQYIAGVYARDVWHNDVHMVEYCGRQIAAVAWLPDGSFIPVEKQSLEKRFCFGESGYDYWDAVKMAQHARTSEDYFTAENMRKYQETIDDLKKQREDVFPDCCAGCTRVYVIADRAYYDQPDGSPLKDITWFAVSDLIDALGGSVYKKDVPGAHFTARNNSFHVPTNEELDIIIGAYEYAAGEHLKKVKTYLKRYGMSKIHTWTYWRDE